MIYLSHENVPNSPLSEAAGDLLTELAQHLSCVLEGQPARGKGMLEERGLEALKQAGRGPGAEIDAELPDLRTQVPDTQLDSFYPSETLHANFVREQ